MNFIEVCAGCGGLSTGLIKAGLKPLLLNEINPVYCKTLEHNHPNVPMSYEDINKLDLKKYRGDVHLLVGGVPCQSFSHAGKRKGFEDERGNLILRFGELVSHCEPDFFLIENVKGLLTHKTCDRKTIDIVIEKLMESTACKYDIVYRVLNAHDYNVPQKRERLFIVGYKIGKKFEFPQQVNTLRPVLNDLACMHLPDGDGDTIGYTYSEEKKRVMELVPQGGCWVDLPEDVKNVYMGNSISSSGGKRGYAKRLSMTKPSTTLTTSPNQKQTEKCHPLYNRPLNIREYAAIQTFPPEYRFFGSIIQQYSQIGNAVPVNLAYYIGCAILKSFQ